MSTPAHQLSESDLSQLTEAAQQLAARAAEAIMEVYAQAFVVEAKSDASPLTEADLASHRILETGLKGLDPRFPVLSEESSERVFADRHRWRRFWLIDPLDGTREFISKNGEFAINIALIENHQAVLGIIYQPTTASCVSAYRGGPANKTANNQTQVLRCVPAPRTARIATSRSHHSPELEAALKKLGPYQTSSLGSSLKFNAIAAGELDLYPRLPRTCSEWDIAAGQVIVEQAGGALLDLEGNAMRYNTRADTIMPGFIAYGDTQVDWLQRMQWTPVTR